MLYGLVLRRVLVLPRRRRGRNLSATTAAPVTLVSRQAVGEAVADVVRAVANGRVVDQRVEMADARGDGGEEAEWMDASSSTSRWQVVRREEMSVVLLAWRAMRSVSGLVEFA